MEQLEITKGKSVVVPRIINRYMVIHYNTVIGWRADCEVYATPESALQAFISRCESYPDKNIKFYKVIEVELEVPFVPKNEG